MILRDKRVVGSGGLALASLGTSMITILTLPLVTGLYSTAVYAQFALVLVTATMLATAASGRYEIACIVLPHTPAGDLEAAKMARLSVRVGLASCLGLAATAVALVGLGVGEGSFGSLGILCTPLAVAFIGAGVIQMVIDTRAGNFHLIAGMKLAEAGILAGGQILLGTWAPTAASLIVPLLLSCLPNVARLAYLLLRLPHGCPFTYRELARRHSRYPRFQAPAALASALSLNILTYATAVAYGDSTVGLLVVAMRFVMFPSSVVVTPVNTVFLKEAGRLSSDRVAAARLYRRTLGALLLVGVVGFSVVPLVIGPATSILGPDWSGAQTLVLATIPMGLAAFAGSPANAALEGFGQQRQLLLWRLALLVVAPAAVLAGPALGWSAAFAIGLASWAVLCFTLGYAGWGLRVIRTAALPVDLVNPAAVAVEREAVE